MDIIKNGDPKVVARKKNPRLTFICYDCGCIFSCVAAEYHELFNRNETTRYAYCPECHGPSHEQQEGNHV